jgi:hypothetical protein
MNTNIRVAPMVAGAGLVIDGDKVTINQLTISNPELAAYLISKEGPEQLVALVDLINLAVSVKNLAGSSLETENVKKSAEMVVQSLNGTVASLLESIKLKTGQLMDPESGVIAQKMRETATSIGDNQESKLRDLLSPKNDGTPIFDLQSTLTTALTAHVNGLKTDITAVTQLLNEYIGAQKKGKELYANSREKGGDLETLLDSMIQLESSVHGDDARYVGDTPAPSGDSVGDELITLNKGVTNGEEVRIVWEAKTDKDFKDKKGRLKRDKVADELTSAIDNREAVCGIFVSDIAGLDMQVQPVWQEFEGNKLIIVLDPEDPDQRLVRMAYLWARSYALRALTPEEGEYDVEAIERVLNALKREFDGLTHLKRLHTPIRTNIKEAEEFVKTLEDNLEGLLDELRDLMSPSDEDGE